MKKFLTFILAFTIGLTTLSAAGCKEKDSPSSSVQTVERLEIEKTNLLLTLGDKAELSVSYNPLENGVLTWTSSSPSVVSVDANGYVEALRVGTATVTAHYGTKQVSCKIEVGLSGNVPTIVFDEDVNETMTLVKGETFGFGSRVRFNGKDFEDAEIEYFVSDQTVGSMVDGAFVANNVTGSTQISVFATWRGQTVHAKTVTVNVIAESSVLLNGGRLKEIKLYTTAQHEGASYATSQTISDVYVVEDGVSVSEYTLSVLDSGIAAIEKKGDVWEVTGLKSGKTSLLVSYDGKEFPFAITVERPVYDSGVKAEYSLSDGKYFDEQTQTLQYAEELFEGFGSLVSYELDGKEYKAKDGQLNLSERKDCAVTLYNETVGYKVTFDVYAMLIDELADFEKIYAGDTAKDVKGTYVLCKDIVEPNTVLKMPEGKVENNFAGTFDGRGHVLSFTLERGETYRFGLFGKFLKGATIKNVALNNVTMDGTTGKTFAGVLCAEGADSNTTPDSTVENVFVDLKFSQARTHNLAFMGNAMWKTVMKNVIIHVPEVPMPVVSDSNQEFAYGSFARGEAADVKDCYVVSTAPTYVTNSATNFKKTPVLYANYTAMRSAGNDYSSFDADYWDVTSYGIPVWKTLVKDFKL